MKRTAKIILRTIVAIVILIIVVAGGYVGYMQAKYYRIDDLQSHEMANNSDVIMSAGEEYTITTYNVGFGAYLPDFSFFMDTGTLQDGTQLVGESSRAISEGSVIATTQAQAQLIESYDPDFALFQEVDQDADRSHHVDQSAIFADTLSEYGSTYALNFHSAYLAYPINEPHGAVTAGIESFSNVHVDSVTRHSLPITTAFFGKFFDLDRCFDVMEIPVSNGKRLLLVNIHMSAYDEGGVIRAQQLETLNAFLAEAAEAGDYVIVGGDWNHALGGSREMYLSRELAPDWALALEDDQLADGYHFVIADNITEVPTCRNSEMPYEPGITYTVTIDGFLVSSNIEASSLNIDAGFAYSDHNPVVMTFKLIG